MNYTKFWDDIEPSSALLECVTCALFHFGARAPEKVNFIQILNFSIPAPLKIRGGLGEVSQS